MKKNLLTINVSTDDSKNVEVSWNISSVEMDMYTRLVLLTSMIKTMVDEISRLYNLTLSSHDSLFKDIKKE